MLKWTSGFHGGCDHICSALLSVAACFCRPSPLLEGYFSSTFGVPEETWLCKSSASTSSLEEIKNLGKWSLWIHESYSLHALASVVLWFTQQSCLPWVIQGLSPSPYQARSWEKGFVMNNVSGDPLCVRFADFIVQWASPASARKE